MEHCIVPLLQNSRLDPRNRMFLEEYSRALSLPYINNIGKTIIMCLNPTDAALLKEFWDANQELISLSLMALKQYKNNEEKDAIEEALDAINALQGKRPKHTITYNGPNGAIENKQTNQSNLMYDLVTLYYATGKKKKEETVEYIKKKYSDIGKIFCDNMDTTGYKWNNELGIGITTQRQRYAEEIIKAIAAKDGFTVQ